MSNLVQRLLLFFLGLPAIVAIVWLLPAARHAATVALLTAFAAGSGVELGRLFEKRGVRVSPALCGLRSALVTLSFYAGAFIGGSPLEAAGIGILSTALLSLVVFAPIAFSAQEKLPDALSRAAAEGFALIYPGMLSGFTVLIVTSPPRASEAILSFALMVFGSDSIAWLMGMTLGKRRGLVAASPNKSLAGFAGAFIGALSGGILADAVFPGACGLPRAGIALLSLLVAAAAIVGDLFESALKRSAGAKDSGARVPGRGGMLDSFDSLLYAAPLFFAGIVAFGLFR